MHLVHSLYHQVDLVVDLLAVYFLHHLQGIVQWHNHLHLNLQHQHLQVLIFHHRQMILLRKLKLIQVY
tara:strand:- start:152 stop:355 length:204 start_codon:yes stop_codon:yes gene_type:complete